MSLDVTLTSDKAVQKKGTGIFVRMNGQTVELTLEQARERWPEKADQIEEVISETNEVFSGNITHNLTTMAAEVSERFYQAMWRPEELEAKQAMDIIEPLAAGIQTLEANPAKYKKLNPENGWGTYDQLLTFAKNYEAACREWPLTKIEVSR